MFAAATSERKKRTKKSINGRFDEIKEETKKRKKKITVNKGHKERIEESGMK